MKRVKISEVCIISNGYAFKSSKYVNDEGARIIRITNVQKGKIEDNDPKLYPFEELEKLDSYKIFEGDILMSLTGNVGRVGKFPKKLLPAYINQRVCRVMPKNDSLDVNYLFHYLNSSIFENEAINNSAGAAQLNLSSKWLANHEIPLPPLEEQQAIAEKLDQAQKIIDLNEAEVARYDKLAQALFIDMFGDPVQNPKGWEMKKLGEVCDVSSGSTPSRSVSEYWDNGTIPWIKTGEVKGNVIYETEEKITEMALKETSCKLYSKGSLLIAMYGQGKTRGNVAVMGIDATTNQACAVLSKNINLDVQYLLQLLKLNYEDLRNLGRGGNQPNLNVGLIKNYQIIYPPITLQNEFAKRIEQIEILKNQAQQELEQSKNLFQSLLQESFKG
ncbi:restriction endonuclease subunit S [Riemerella anatipestifer]|uniref:restriction endonuclease subunit S n=1 Tax=Riemerella anatipestifer TaxID=34085 RepID=UPI003DA89D52